VVCSSLIDRVNKSISATGSISFHQSDSKRKSMGTHFISKFDTTPPNLPNLTSTTSLIPRRRREPQTLIFNTANHVIRPRTPPFNQQAVLAYATLAGINTCPGPALNPDPIVNLACGALFECWRDVRVGSGVREGVGDNEAPEDKEQGERGELHGGWMVEMYRIKCLRHAELWFSQLRYHGCIQIDRVADWLRSEVICRRRASRACSEKGHLAGRSTHHMGF
jgi:hypothetical protein